MRALPHTARSRGKDESTICKPKGNCELWGRSRRFLETMNKHQNHIHSGRHDSSTAFAALRPRSDQSAAASSKCLLGDPCSVCQQPPSLLDHLGNGSAYGRFSGHPRTVGPSSKPMHAPRAESSKGLRSRAASVSVTVRLSRMVKPSSVGATPVSWTSRKKLQLLNA